MKMSTGRGQLHQAMQTTLEHWDQTQRVWHDAVRKEFEEECLVPLQSQVQATLRGIDRLWLVMAQMEQECR